MLIFEIALGVALGALLISVSRHLWVNHRKWLVRGAVGIVLVPIVSVVALIVIGKAMDAWRARQQPTWEEFEASGPKIKETKSSEPPADLPAVPPGFVLQNMKSEKDPWCGPKLPMTDAEFDQYTGECGTAADKLVDPTEDFQHLTGKQLRDIVNGARK